MTFLGADTDQLRSTARSVADGAQRLEETLTTLGPLVRGVEWTGPDAEEFRTRFDDAHHRCSETAQTLSERGARLEREAEEQDETSDLDARSGAGGSPDRGPSAGSDSGSGTDRPGTPSWIDTILDEYRGQGIGKIGDFLKDSPWARRIMKTMPVIGALPEVADLIGHVRDGDTGSAIGDIGSIALSFVPGIGSIGGVIDGVSPAFMPEGASLMDWGGKIESNGFAVQQGEMTAMVLSASLGFEKGSTGDNVIRSSAGVGAYLLLTANPVFGVANTLTGAWNTFR